MNPQDRPSSGLETALRESEELFRTLCSLARVGIFISDAQGQCTYINEVGAELIGGTPQQAIQSGWLRAIHPEDRGRVEKLWTESLETGTDFSTEYRFQHVDGSDVWVQGDAAARRSDQGELIGLIGTFTNITPRKQAERLQELENQRDITKRKEAEKQLRLTQFSVDSCCASVFWIRRDARFLYVNDAAVQRFGFSRDELLLMTVHDIDPAYPPEAWPEYWANMQHNRSMTFETQLRKKDGDLVPVEVTTNLLEFEGQELLFAFVTDVTMRKKAEQERRQHRDALAHMTRLSTMGEMVAGFAHEVKQPLYAIGNFSTAASISLYNAQSGHPIRAQWLGDLREFNAGIRRASQRANEIIGRLREFARKNEQQREQIDINRLVYDSIEMVAFEARQSKTAVETDVDHRLPQIVADRIQCEQVVVNLLHNAYEALAKQDSPRRVVVRTRYSDENVEIRVEDNGPGIHPDQRAKLFEAFVTTKPGGMGMGLAISRSIVEDHGGKLWVTSDPGSGATFHVALPLRSALHD